MGDVKTGGGGREEEEKRKLGSAAWTLKVQNWGEAPGVKWSVLPDCHMELHKTTLSTLKCI